VGCKIIVVLGLAVYPLEAFLEKWVSPQKLFCNSVRLLFETLFGEAFHALATSLANAINANELPFIGTGPNAYYGRVAFPPACRTPAIVIR
jgi:hypothetical protein